jgi:hypothetical protein
VSTASDAAGRHWRDFKVLEPWQHPLPVGSQHFEKPRALVWMDQDLRGICRPEANIKLGFRQSRKDCYGQRLGMEEWCVRVASLVMRVNYTFMNNSKTPGNGVKS